MGVFLNGACIVSSKHIVSAIETLESHISMIDVDAEESGEHEGFLLVRNAAQDKELRFMERKHHVTLRFIHDDLLGVDLPLDDHGRVVQDIGLCFWIDSDVVTQANKVHTLILQKLWEPDLMIGPKHSLNVDIDPTYCRSGKLRKTQKCLQVL